MDTYLTDRHWKIAAKVVLHAMRQKVIALEEQAALDREREWDYPMSKQEEINQAELDMYQAAIDALLAILL